MSLPAAFLRDAERLIPAERRFDDPTSTLAFGTDASFYRLIPCWWCASSPRTKWSG